MPAQSGWPGFFSCSIYHTPITVFQGIRYLRCLDSDAKMVGSGNSSPFFGKRLGWARETNGSFDGLDRRRQLKPDWASLNSTPHHPAAFLATSERPAEISRTAAIEVLRDGSMAAGCRFAAH